MIGLIIGGPVRTSVFVDKVTHSSLYLCCQQLRTHSSEHVDVYLRVASRAIIEDCSNIRFGPYQWDNEKSEKLHSDAGIDQNLLRYKFYARPEQKNASTDNSVIYVSCIFFTFFSGMMQ